MLDEARHFASLARVLNQLVSMPACLLVSDWYAALESQGHAHSSAHPPSSMEIIPSGSKRNGAVL
jgi:hypothetical protein